MSLKVSSTLPASPTQVPGSRTVKSPSRMLCRLVKRTVRSSDSSEPLDFPLLDFPLFLAMVGGEFPGPLGAISLSPDRFIVSPQRSTQIRGSRRASRLHRLKFARGQHSYLDCGSAR